MYCAGTLILLFAISGIYLLKGNIESNHCEKLDFCDKNFITSVATSNRPRESGSYD